MDRGLPCPYCSTPLPGDARTCPHCGIDLVLMALLAERASLEHYTEEPAAGSFPPLAVVPRLGEYLVDQGLLSPQQLTVALQRQEELAGRGQRRLLGQTLIDMELLDRETLDRAITRQIIELHSALQDANRQLERRVAERTAELRRAVERMGELNQVKANLISNISHELRTPLTQIVGYVDLLVRGELGPMAPEQRNALEVIRRAVQRLESLIADLLEFSSASRQGLKLKLEPVDLPQLVDDTIRRSQEKAAKAGVKVEASLPAALAPLQADREKLGWVIHQLVDNGIKFTPAGGQVTVEAFPDGRNEIVCVSDTGIGIPPNRIQEIFEPFYQLDGSSTRRFAGTGLGLALVRLILNAHGAAIKVESREGSGTRFCFQLPVAESAP